jgi:Fur family peroxide stress response transcriptional regulator
MSGIIDSSERILRQALEESGQRFTEQRAAVYRFLAGTDVHPTAEEVYRAVRSDLPGISLATVYKSLETLVGCGLAVKLTFADQSSRYDGRTDPHHHARCVVCGQVMDLSGDIAASEIEALRRNAASFTVTGYRLELSGYCAECVPRGSAPPVSA